MQENDRKRKSGKGEGEEERKGGREEGKKIEILLLQIKLMS